MWTEHSCQRAVYPCSRTVNTAVSDSHDDGPLSRAPVHATLVDGPLRWHVFTASVDCSSIWAVYVCMDCDRLTQRFSNWGPRTKGGPRRVPTGSARGFRKVVIVCTVLTIYDPYAFKFAQVSQSLSLSALRWSVGVVWHDRLSVDVS